ncbi:MULTISPECIES: hypothetical protein [Haloferax]|uniref:Uncharacterized protein n=2 Tax=Haloferax TaxID=2251 RepID=A0A6G1Z1Q4_9EURY|nr:MULTISPECIES: hypothetical protein [Haloferax]KAB1185672.1 hypothetical protein Hfx1149_14645 [Haloferax sp. CBA1149]KAB1185830.1 hypothetical protein Hfx1149_14520 [Haloferax sp. CBA1149]KAB1186897.1 hypothetical protein Hfx1149_02180 [Haloferax sp. CBA1149]KAB1187792.1 hypothetical protein Hfx1149_06995 [Haloferax sp. CBA1149]MRW79527.1 hypothetical protein [Haloferax marinisediminis]
MSNSKNDQYAAAQGRTYLRGELGDKRPEYVRRFAGLVDDAHTLDLLNHYCSLWADRAGDFLDTRMAEIIISSSSTRSINTAYEFGNVSQLQGMVGLVDRTKDGDEGLTRMARMLTDEGAIGAVLGPPGSGKTAMTLDIGRIWKAVTGGKVVTNIKWNGGTHISGAREMLDEMANFDGPVLAIIDEGSQSLTSRGAEAQSADRFAKALKYVRKKETGDKYAKRGSVLIVGHTRADTAKDLRRLYSAIFEKPSRADPGRVKILESTGTTDKFEEVAEYKGITDTAERYDEHEASSFAVDLEDETDDDQEDVETADDARRKEAISTAIRAARPWDDDGMSYADIGKENSQDTEYLVPYSTSWVGDRVREWQKGQHRDLVAAPEGESA